MDYNHLKDFLCRRLTAPNSATAYQISENPMATLQQRLENLETQRFLAAYQVSEEHPHPPWGQKSDRTASATAGTLPTKETGAEI